MTAKGFTIIMKLSAIYCCLRETLQELYPDHSHVNLDETLDIEGDDPRAGPTNTDNVVDRFTVEPTDVRASVEIVDMSMKMLLSFKVLLNHLYMTVN